MNMLTRLKRRMGEIGCYTYVTVLAVFAAFPLLFSYTFGETKPEEEETSDGKEKAAGMKPWYKPLEKAEGKVLGAETLRNGHKDEKME